MKASEEGSEGEGGARGRVKERCRAQRQRTSEAGDALAQPKTPLLLFSPSSYTRAKLEVGEDSVIANYYNDMILFVP